MLKKNKIGVWGYSIVGKAAVNYLILQNFKQIQVADKKDLLQEDANFLATNNIKFFNQDNILYFLESCDYIIASPGINIEKYLNYKNKFISELDLFYSLWEKQIIAITGTIGKTSITHLLKEILDQNNKKVITGGNIGTAALDLVKDKKKYNAALLEVSSFQLENIKNFAADLAVWTNFYPNHLDRHASIENYFKAKLQIILNQKASQKALLNWDLRERINKIKELKNRAFCYFSADKFLVNKLKKQEILYLLQDNFIVKYSYNLQEKLEQKLQQKKLIDITYLPQISYKLNWLILVAISDILNININLLKKINNLVLPEHRLEYLGAVNNIKFFNDSKSTLSESTLAAIDKLESNNIHLFLGGLSKDVDRSILIEKISNKVKTVYCFGHEADYLHNLCLKFKINSYSFDNLTSAFNKCIKLILNRDIVLFSPAGASFDQFENYKQRGNCFKTLVEQFKTKNS